MINVIRRFVNGISCHLVEHNGNKFVFHYTNVSICDQGVFHYTDVSITVTRVYIVNDTFCDAISGTVTSRRSEGLS